jgi:NAD(P)-dependent dehydrogenase (short-subunit alcohol dehydrogenase family)
MNSVVITGVASGIGYETAAELVRRGYRVFGSVRREEDARRVEASLGEHFMALMFDVTDGEAIAEAAAQVAEALGGGGLYALVNNAGIVVPGPLMHVALEDFRQQFEVNLFGLLDVTQRFLPLLGARIGGVTFPPGRIVNISSVSGRIAYPFLGAYAASKHALEALSDAMRRELMLYGVDVIVIEPGTARTPIKEKFKSQIASFRDTDYGALSADLERQVQERERSGLPTEKVERVICTALEASRPRTRYPVPRRLLTGWLIPRLLPDRWLDRLTASRLGLKPAAR